MNILQVKRKGKTSERGDEREEGGEITMRGWIKGSEKQ